MPYTLNKDLFIDSKLAIASEQIIREYFNLQSYAKNSTRYKQQRMMSQLYEKLFGNIRITDICEAFVTKLIQALSFKETLYVFRMVLFLVRHEMIKDEKLERLTFFSNHFYWKGNKEQYLTLMELDGFEILKSRNEIVNNENMILLNLSDVAFYDEKDRVLVNNLLKKTKIAKKWTPAVREMKCYVYRKISNYMLSKASLKGITRHDILEYMHIPQKQSTRSA